MKHGAPPPSPGLTTFPTSLATGSKRASPAARTTSPEGNGESPKAAESRAAASPQAEEKRTKSAVVTASAAAREATVGAWRRRGEPRVMVMLSFFCVVSKGRKEVERERGREEGGRDRATHESMSDEDFRKHRRFGLFALFPSLGSRDTARQETRSLPDTPVQEYWWGEKEERRRGGRREDGKTKDREKSVSVFSLFVENEKDLQKPFRRQRKRQERKKATRPPLLPSLSLCILLSSRPCSSPHHA